MDEGVEEHDHFEGAAEQLTMVMASGTRIPDATLLELYGLYKQGTVGPCRSSKPSIFDPKGRAKWSAWHALGNVTRDEARDRYVVAVRQLLGGPGEGQAMPGSAYARTAVAPPVSSLAEPLGGGDQDGGMAAGCSRLHDALDDGDSAAFRGALEASTPAQAEAADADGCTPLHLAADRGNEEAIRLLVDKGVCLDLQDAEGLTALHYASLAHQEGAFRALIAAGADRSIADGTGALPDDVAPSHWAVEPRP